MDREAGPVGDEAAGRRSGGDLQRDPVGLESVRAGRRVLGENLPGRGLRVHIDDLPVETGVDQSALGGLEIQPDHLWDRGCRTQPVTAQSWGVGREPGRHHILKHDFHELRPDGSGHRPSVHPAVVLSADDHVLEGNLVVLIADPDRGGVSRDEAHKPRVAEPLVGPGLSSLGASYGSSRPGSLRCRDFLQRNARRREGGRISIALVLHLVLVENPGVGRDNSGDDVGGGPLPIGGEIGVCRRHFQGAHRSGAQHDGEHLRQIGLDAQPVGHFRHLGWPDHLRDLCVHRVDGRTGGVGQCQYSVIPGSHVAHRPDVGVFNAYCRTLDLDVGRSWESGSQRYVAFQCAQEGEGLHAGSGVSPTLDRQVELDEVERQAGSHDLHRPGEIVHGDDRTGGGAGVFRGVALQV